MAEEHKNELLFRAYVVLAMVLLMSFTIAGKVFYIQWVEGDKWRAMSDSLYIRMIPVEAEMGNVLTEEGTILATSTVSFELRMDMKSSAMDDNDFETHVDSLGFYLSKYVDGTISAKSWASKLRNGRKKGERYMLIAKDVTFEEMQQIRQFPLYNLGRYKGGLIVLEHLVRSRPFGDLARRTIGIHKHGMKSFGIEGKYKDDLTGEQGYRLMQYLPGNIKLPVNDLTEIAPQPGNDIVTTLDMGMQDMAHSALKNALTFHNAESGLVVVMEVKTGKIRTMVNLDLDGEAYVEQYNHAVGSAVEPGSIFKLASYMALIEDGYVKPDDLIDIEKGKSTFYDRTMVDAHEHGLDTVTVKKAFEMSSNVGVAKLVQRFYGAQPHVFIERLAEFGMTSKVGIDLGGEGQPFVKHPTHNRKEWSGITLPWMSMGYELKVTPIQLLTLYAAVANDGRMMQPMLVSEIQKQGETIRKIHPYVLTKKIASKRTIRHMQSLLEGVVETGTASGMRSNRYRYAGKTGTAHIRDQKGVEIAYRSSFVGYFPADEPVYAAIVVIKGPKTNGYYGSEVALPVFKKVADYCFNSRKEMFPQFAEDGDKLFEEWKTPQWEAGFRPDFKKVCNVADIPYENQSESDWTITKNDADSKKLQLTNRICPDKQVPNVVGMGLRDALFALENRGLRVDPSGVGKVRRQSITAGTSAQGQYVRIYLE